MGVLMCPVLGRRVFGEIRGMIDGRRGIRRRKIFGRCGFREERGGEVVEGGISGYGFPGAGEEERASGMIGLVWAASW